VSFKKCACVGEYIWTYLRCLYLILCSVFKPNFGIFGPRLVTWRKYELADKDTGDRDEIYSCCTWRQRADQRNREIGKNFNLFCLSTKITKLLKWWVAASTLSNIIAYCNCLQHAACLNSEAFSLCLTKTYCFFNTKNNELLVFREITDGYSENHTKRKVCFDRVFYC